MVGVVVDAEQVAHRVAVFDAVQAPHRHAARIGIRRIDGEHLVLDPALECRLLRAREPRLALRGHETGARVQEHPDPQLGFQDLWLGFQPVEGHLALVVAITVALVAVLLEDGNDGGVEGLDRGLRMERSGNNQGECHYQRKITPDACTRHQLGPHEIQLEKAAHCPVFAVRGHGVFSLSYIRQVATPSPETPQIVYRCCPRHTSCRTDICHAGPW